MTTTTDASHDVNFTVEHLKSIGANFSDERIDLADVYIDKDDNNRDESEYSDEDFKGLMRSIESMGGLLQAIVVSEIEDSEETDHCKYGLVAGFRRALALTELAKADEKFGKNIPARVLHDPGNLAVVKSVQIIENVQRKDINVMQKALAFKEALNDKSAGIRQKDLATMSGLSEPNVSQILKLLRFPESIQDWIKKDEISFSHAREIIRRVPEDRWIEFAKEARNMSYGAFIRMMDRVLGTPAGEGDEEGEQEESGGQQRQQNKPKALTPTQIKEVYFPYLQERTKKADKKEKKYTEADLLKAREDTFWTVLQEKETALGKAIKPFIEKLEEQEEKEKKNKEVQEKRDKFFKEQCRKLESLLYAKVDPSQPEEERTTGNLTKCYSIVVKDMLGLDEDARKELGFELETDEEKLTKGLADFYSKWTAEKQEAARKREERKKEKEAEEAKKKAEEEAKKKGESSEAESSESSESEEEQAAESK